MPLFKLQRSTYPIIRYPIKGMVDGAVRLSLRYPAISNGPYNYFEPPARRVTLIDESTLDPTATESHPSNSTNSCSLVHFPSPRFESHPARPHPFDLLYTKRQVSKISSRSGYLDATVHSCYPETFCVRTQI